MVFAIARRQARRPRPNRPMEFESSVRGRDIRHCVLVLVLVFPSWNFHALEKFFTAVHPPVPKHLQIRLLDEDVMDVRERFPTSLQRLRRVHGLRTSILRSHPPLPSSPFLPPVLGLDSGVSPALGRRARGRSSFCLFLHLLRSAWSCRVGCWRRSLWMSKQGFVSLLLAFSFPCLSSSSSLMRICSKRQRWPAPCLLRLRAPLRIAAGLRRGLMRYVQ